MRTRHAALIAVALAGATGCSLIGLGIGAVADRKPRPPKPHPTWDVREFGAGTEVALTLVGGERVVGRFDGLELRPLEEYAPLYAARREARPEGLELPALGAAVWLEPDGDAHEVDLVGLDLRGVVVRRGVEVRPVPFARVAGLRDAGGLVASGEALERLVRSRRMPTLSVLRLVEPPRRVILDDVAQVEVFDRSASGKLKGFLIGLALDVAFVVWAVNELNEPWGTPTCRENDPYCTSCPFVFGFDGNSWRREAELLGAATLESAQATDRARLDHLAPAGGRYRIRFVNEMEEVDHLDAVRLLAVDLPAGVRAVPSPEGQVLALVHPRPARRVVDIEGRELTSVLAATDGHIWLGQPLGRDPGRDPDRRESVLLEFDRPEGAEAVTLAFNARSTLWGVQMLVELLSLHGAGLDAWRARADSDPATRSAFLTALAREGLPHVRIWDGLDWRFAGALRNLGPALAREQALRVPLEDVPGNVLRVRVDTTPGFWALDSAVADFATPPPIAVHVLETVSATAQGRDVRGLLEAEDGRRVTLARDQSVELAFRAPRDAAAGMRSILVEATGYYTPLLDVTGTADEALFELLVSEPGAFGRHNLRRLGEELERAAAAATR